MPTLHAFFQYFIYKWKAKGRHGTHSPFVYDLIERVVQSDDLIDKRYLIEDRETELRYENLVSRIAMRYDYKKIIQLPETGGQAEGIDMLILGKDCKQWQEELSSYIRLLKNESAVIVKDIHKTAANTDAWERLCADERVLLSIDTYRVGILFFKKEFREKQHFVLNY